MNPNPIAADLFQHVRIVMGMVIGLGITRILTGVAGMIQHATRPQLSIVHMLWAGSMLLELISFWWWEFELATLPDWTFATFLFLIVYCITLYLIAALLFPDRLDGYDGYWDFFLKRRHWFFSLFALTFGLDVIDTLIKGAPYFDNLGIWYLVQVPIGVTLAVIGIWTKNWTFHLVLVLLNLAYQAAWVGKLFTVHI
ncbi:MAG TPA: hypothetical protein PK286_11290 [Devosia sp.]|mgnify:CR=1 FL=1|nr:hypothetical protein [Devosia sp.]